MTEKAVFLDTETFGKGFSMNPLQGPSLSWNLYPSTSHDPEEIGSRIREATIVLTNKVPLTKEILKKAPNLKLICSTATGYDPIDVKAAEELGITVCNAPGYGTSSVVPFTMLLLLALFYNLIPYDKAVRSGRWEKSPQFCFLDYPMSELEGKILGVVGSGAMGKGVAKLAESFGMKVLFMQHSDPNRAIPNGVPLPELLQRADAVTLHVPLTTSTRNFIAAKELALMKPTAFLVNTARGALINEADLAKALKEGRIAGAAIDVLSREPPPHDHPLLQKDVPNLILTPHVAWATREARTRLLEIVAKNISSFLQGKPQNVVKK